MAFLMLWWKTSLGLHSASIYSTALLFFPLHHRAVLISERLTRRAADGRVYLLAAVCGDSQAVGHQAGCLVLLHQPDRNNRDGHLDDRGTVPVRT